MFEATPDMPAQMKLLKSMAGDSARETPDAIFLTHAHIGHYTGLMYLGKEAMDAKAIPVHVMPKMKSYLESNGPWSQLVTRNNIALRELRDGEPVRLGATTPIASRAASSAVLRDGRTLAFSASNRLRSAAFSAPWQSFQGRPCSPMTMA